jgi:transcriptional regulator with XRE-family HTH domain
MRDEKNGRILRMLRIKKSWRQVDVAEAAGLSRAAVSRHELGLLDDANVGAVRLHAAALGLRAELVLVGRGGDLAKMTDEEHAAIVEHIAATLIEHGWLVDAETSFNHYGDRGRFDLLAFHPATGRLLIVEVKTELTDLQDLLGVLNVKERLAGRVATEHGWAATSVSTLLAVAGTDAARKTVAAHPALFGSFTIGRGQSALWTTALDRPRRTLIWVLPSRAGRSAWRAGRKRVRRHAAAERPATGPNDRSPGTNAPDLPSSSQEDR